MIRTYEIGAGLAHEMELLDRVVKDPSERHVLFWRSNQALVAPRSLVRKPGFTAAAERLTAEGWPVHVRKTGGDVTPQGPGIVNVTLVYARDGINVDETYDSLCRPMEQALGERASRGWNDGAFCDGAYNVQWDGLKFAGTAQRFRRCLDRRKMAVLSHALMLFLPPSDEAILRINHFLEAVSEPRIIHGNRHTGLPPHLEPERFVATLHDLYLAEIAGS